MNEQIEKIFLHAYDTYSDAIFRHCLYRLYNREHALELTQETFTRYAEYLHQGKDVEYIQSFLYRTANNLIVDEKRKQMPLSVEVLEEQGIEFVDGHIHSDKAVDAQLLLRLIDTLEDMYRIPLLMRYIDNLQPREIASILHISVNVVSVRIHRAVKLLQRMTKP